MRVFPERDYADAVADVFTSSLRDANGCVLTGGTTAEIVYRALARQTSLWQGLAVWFSDERSVPPEHEASNYGMVRRVLWGDRPPPLVCRMRGEDPPELAANAYDSEMNTAIAAGIEVALLSLGVDGHICALFPGSPAIEEREAWCVAVQRPDGLHGLTLTPIALQRARRILVMVTGTRKARVARRLLRGSENQQALPAAVMRSHPNVTLLLDSSAAAEVASG